MSRSLVAFVFVILVIVIIFLMFQVNDNSAKCKEAKVGDQDRLARASKLLVQSTTQDHPLLSFESAIEAKIIIEEVLSRHGGIGSAERNLKLPKGRLESLRTKIHDQYGITVERYPELNFMSESALATASGLQSSTDRDESPAHHRSSSSHRRSHRKRH